jgi:hypothetical protein
VGPGYRDSKFKPSITERVSEKFSVEVISIKFYINSIPEGLEKFIANYRFSNFNQNFAFNKQFVSANSNNYNNFIIFIDSANLLIL